MGHPLSLFIRRDSYPRHVLNTIPFVEFFPQQCSLNALGTLFPLCLPLFTLPPVLLARPPLFSGVTDIFFSLAIVVLSPCRSTNTPIRMSWEWACVRFQSRATVPHLSGGGQTPQLPPTLFSKALGFHTSFHGLDSPKVPSSVCCNLMAAP